MILGFKTQINGKPTYFVSKIWIGIESKFSQFNEKGNRLFNFPKEYIQCGQKGLLTFQRPKPKLHTIREDKTDRWKPGMMIDFFINVRTKDMFRFAPRVPVISLQTIKITRTDHLSLNCYPGQMWIQNIFIGGIQFKRAFMVQIDGAIINHSTLNELAINDGFDSLDDFFNWFCDDFEGKIIHWTDKKY